MKVSIVVPSFNQGRFLRATLDSILTQDHPDVEVLVFDGGSTDESVDVLKSYGDRIFWVSRKDKGQTDAINQGLRRATGDILAYLNSDDIYYPGAISRIVRHFRENPDCEVVYGDADHIHEDGTFMERYYTEAWDYDRLQDICYICQPSVFWRRAVLERHGYFDDALRFGMDYEYWLRVGKHTPFHCLRGDSLAGSRMYSDNKTLGQRFPVHREILKVVLRHATRPPYVWLKHLAHIGAEQEYPTGRDTPEIRNRFVLRFVHNVFRFADEYGIEPSPELCREMLGHLRDRGY